MSDEDITTYIYDEENKKEIVLENVTKFVNTIFDITQQ